MAWGADPALTIYNQNFAVIRETVPVDLKAGNNVVRFANATAHVEPDSVILRDPSGRMAVQVLEQNYRNDPVSQERLLALMSPPCRVPRRCTARERSEICRQAR